MNFTWRLGLFVLLLQQLIGWQAWGALPCDMNEKCLKVFDNQPASWPKCYCTTLCQESLGTLLQNCSSGQALWDNCGICLRCAKARGERCGGPHNVDGSCAAGLACLIRVNPGLPPREMLEAEQAAFGICVDETSQDCPKTGENQAARKRNRGVNCRPGRIGLLLEALYCPDLGACHPPTPSHLPTTPLEDATAPPPSSSFPPSSFATHDSERTRPTKNRVTRPPRRPSLSFITLLLSGGDE